MNASPPSGLRAAYAAFFFLCAALVGCDDAMLDPIGEPPPAQDGAAPMGDAGCDGGTCGCEEGLTQRCFCSTPGERGTRTCTGGTFGACTGCAAPDTYEPKCVAGTYVGVMEGTYRSEASGFCGATPGVEQPLDIEMEFEMVKVGGQEFYEVRASCLRVPGREGMAFEVTGMVDCSTGEADLELRGTYVAVSACSLGLAEERFFTKGRMVGTFDPETQSFVDTSFQLQERPPLLGGEPPGGDGTFTAVLDPDAGVPDAGASTDCLGVEFPEDLAPQPVGAAP